MIVTTSSIGPYVETSVSKAIENVFSAEFSKVSSTCDRCTVVESTEVNDAVLSSYTKAYLVLV